jgi:hypothetical protein
LVRATFSADLTCSKSGCWYCIAALVLVCPMTRITKASLNVGMSVTGGMETVTVEGGSGDLIETSPTFHTDVDRDLFDKVPLESSSSSVCRFFCLLSRVLQNHADSHPGRARH